MHKAAARPAGKDVHLEGQLAPIHDSSHKRVCGGSQVLLGPLPGRQQLLQNLWQDALGAVGKHKAVPSGGSDHILLGHLMQPACTPSCSLIKAPHSAIAYLTKSHA